MYKTSFTLITIFLTTLMITKYGDMAAQQSLNSGEVSIGKQVWTKKNLNVDKFRNGDLIPHAKTKEEWKTAGENKQPAWCYYENWAIQDDPENGEDYGRLYNWYAVNDPRQLAPVGYHIPSADEWTMLTNYLGGTGVAGNKMKSKTGWKKDEKNRPTPLDFGGSLTSSASRTNESSFSGLPGGMRDEHGGVLSFGKFGGWWSSTEGDSSFSGVPDVIKKEEGQALSGEERILGKYGELSSTHGNIHGAWSRYLSYADGVAVRYQVNPAFGFSVRCLKD